MLDKDIMFFNYKNQHQDTWLSVVQTWKLCQMDRLNTINDELKMMDPHLKTRTVFTAAYH